mmetsp:Transcript_43726/g.64197  ORF Transcript_43726/g.64197 Transcript_43726/m.64197 type:complete len:127 (-) Transcript_43726:414-794(-)
MFSCINEPRADKEQGRQGQKHAGKLQLAPLDLTRFQPKSHLYLRKRFEVPHESLQAGNTQNTKYRKATSKQLAWRLVGHQNKQDRREGADEIQQRERFDHVRKRPISNVPSDDILDQEIHSHANFN